MLQFDSRKIFNMKCGDVDSKLAVVASFLAESEQEAAMLRNLLLLFAQNRDKGLTGRELAAVRDKHSIAASSWWNLLQRLEAVGLIKVSAGARFYYIQPRFASVLRKVARSAKELL